MTSPVSTELIDAYLRRLGLDREPPTADALGRLHRAQTERVPYETTWIHMGQRWTVDRVESLRRVASGRRGGYCYHVNGAFSLLLGALGYDVTLHVGGVHRAEGPTIEAMENHLVLLVRGLPNDANPGGEWYVDAGLGDALHGPLPLTIGEHHDGAFGFRLTAAEVPFADWRFHHRDGASFPGMTFRAAPTTIDVFAARHLVLSTSPDSPFTMTCTAQRRDEAGVDVLRGCVLSRVTAQGTARRTLTQPNDFFAALADVFHLPLDDAAPDERDRLWARAWAGHLRWEAENTG